MIEQKNFLGKMSKAIEALCCVFLLIMVFSCAAQVICRFVLRIPNTWTEEYSKLSYIAMVLLAWPILEFRDGQLKVVYFLKKFPVSVRTVLFFIINLAYLAYVVLFFASAVRAMTVSWSLKYSAIAWLNSGVQYIPALVAMPLSFIYVVARMFNFKEEVRKHDEFDIDEVEEEEAE